MKVFYGASYVGSSYAFETTRKAKWVADSLQSLPIIGLELVAPESLTLEQVLSVHASEYVNAVRTGEPRSLAESQGFKWDADLWPMVLATNGGAVAAALEAMKSGISGTLSSGLHHAQRNHGHGYCTFNGLVIAAHAVLDAGARSILVLDLDAHCGGGTAALIANETRIWQLDVSVDDYDQYTTSDRIQLTMVQRGQDYLATIE